MKIVHRHMYVYIVPIAEQASQFAYDSFQAYLAADFSCDFACSYHG